MGVSQIHSPPPPLRGISSTTTNESLALQILIAMKLTFEHFLLNDFLKELL